MFPSNPVDGQPFQGEWVFNQSAGVWVKKKTRLKILATGQVVDLDAIWPDSSEHSLVMYGCFNKYFKHQFCSKPDNYKQCWFRLRRISSEFGYEEFFKKGYTDINDLGDWVRAHILKTGSPNQSRCTLMLDLIDIVDLGLEPPVIIPINIAFSMLTGKRSCKSDDFSYCGHNEPGGYYAHIKDLAKQLFHNFWGYDLSPFSDEQLMRCLWVPTKKKNKYGVPTIVDTTNVYSGSKASGRNVYDSVNSTIESLLNARGGYIVGDPQFVFILLSDGFPFVTADISPGYKACMQAFMGSDGTNYVSAVLAFPLTSGFYSGRYKAVLIHPVSVDGFLIDKSLDTTDFELEAVFGHDKHTRSLYHINVSSFFDQGAAGRQMSQPVPIGRFIRDGFYPSGAIGSSPSNFTSNILQRVYFRKRDMRTYYVSPFYKKHLRAVFRTSYKHGFWMMTG